MKKIKRIFCTFLSISMIFTLLTTSALATSAGDDLVNQMNKQPSFIDIVDHWAIEAITFMFGRNLMRGTSDTTFEPDAVFTRAQAATLLYRIADEPTVTGIPAFNDVVPDTWYSDAVAWAYQRNIVQGVGSGRFAPDAPIMREQIVTLLYRLAVYLEQDVAVPPNFVLDFPDANQVSPWAEQAMRWVVYNELVQCMDSGELLPQGTATRAQAAVLLMRFVRLIEPGVGAGDFVLTISVEETTLPQGENFRVNIELKNNSGEDHEFALFGVEHEGTIYFLFSPHIPGEYWIFERFPPPWPIFVFFENGSTISQIMHLNWYYELPQGVYQLTVHASFFLGWEHNHKLLPWEIPCNVQHVSVLSNTIVLTVVN